MVSGIFHSGSGLGNQLHRYVATRVLALDKGYDFSMVAPENFKGKSFMNLDMGVPSNIRYGVDSFKGKILPFQDMEEKYIDGTADCPKLWEEKTPYYNPEFNFIEDNTIIDGEFQDERYFGHRLNEINKWLEVEPIEVPHDTCIIGFRGGEFYMFPELGLPKTYYDEAIDIMKKMGVMKFEVHTDDPELAQKFFPEYNVIHDIGINWRSIRSAKYVIISNSSFYILPRLLKHHEARGAVTLAPRYWARRNTKEWSRPDNFYRAFQYL